MTRFVLPLLALSVVACESSRTIPTAAHPKGESVRCVGLNGKKAPKIEYEYSTQNIVVGLIFSEMIVPPVIVVLKELECPVAEAKP